MEWETRYLIPGMVLKNDLLSEDGPTTAPLMPAGKVITVVDIERLQRHKIESIEIEEYNESFFDLFRKFAASAIKSFNMQGISRVAELYEYIVKRNPELKFDMTRYLEEDIDLINHDINIANMAVALASKYNKTVTADQRIPIKDMAEAGMLLDVGRRAAKKPDVLNLIKRKYGAVLDKYQKVYPNIPSDIFDYYHKNFHQFYSYLILKDGNKLNNVQLTSILLHNEREVGKNGSLGVELGIQNSKLQSVQMAKILKVCELYDILLYRAKEDNPEQPFANVNKEMAKMVASGLTDPYFTKLLSHLVPVYPLGERVELSDGTIAVVSGQNEYDMSKPRVSDLNGNDIDLQKENLVIMGLVSTPTQTSTMSMPRQAVG